MLFSTPMVQAILEGRKSQTRRIMKPQAQAVNTLKERNEAIKRVKGNKLKFIRTYSGFDYAFPESPYLPGDVLWVRESFLYVLRDHAHDLLEGSRTTNQWVYAASFHEDWYAYAKSTYGYKWKPGIHMPFEVARLFLRIKSVKYERLQDILEADAIAEGIELGQPWPEAPDRQRYKLYGWKGYNTGAEAYTFEPISSFFSLWTSINGKDAVVANPWVWAIEFERITKEEALKVKEASHEG
ncbi:syntaxin-like protein [Microcystis phage Mae-Yong924-2]|nr:hypothetical protein [Microcystis phage Mea-Yong924-1]QYC50703.1 syntaxin-like protein [Microcystis phage Mae-Yong924-2]